MAKTGRLSHFAFAMDRLSDTNTISDPIKMSGFSWFTSSLVWIRCEEEALRRGGLGRDCRDRFSNIPPIRIQCFDNLTIGYWRRLGLGCGVGLLAIAREREEDEPGNVDLKGCLIATRKQHLIECHELPHKS